MIGPADSSSTVSQRRVPARVVALGASNLTRLLPLLIQLARERAQGPVEVLAALGLGRSYGIPSRFLWRVLPGIDGCGLWEALGAAAPAPAVGIVMDVGNDILYGVEVPVIAGWVDRALARLRPRVDRLVLAGLPVFEVRRVGALQFALVRTVLVPSCRLSRAEVTGRAERLQGELEALARAHGAEFVTMHHEWYGIDPIHVRPRHWRALSAELLGADGTEGVAARPGGAWRRVRGRVRVHTAVPAQRRILGFEQRAAQPSRRWPDGSTLWTF